MSTTTTVIRRPDGERYDYISLATASDEVLEELLRAGVQPDVADLTGWEFRGFNVAEYLSLARRRKFKQGFFSNGGATAHGYRVRVRQNRLGEAWIDRIKHGESVKHGWCDVYPTTSDGADNLYPNGLLLDYETDRNGRFDPTRLLRDYLVQVYADNRDLLVGKAVAAVRGQRLALGYFVLERYNPSVL